MALFTTRRAHTAAVVGILSTLVLGAAPATAAVAPVLTSSGLSATVNGYQVTARTTVRSDVATSVEKFGVCVRGVNNLNVDFVKAQNTWVTPTGTSHTATQTLPAGTYNYWTCAYDEGRWLTLDAARPFVVTPPDETLVITPEPPPITMPVGDLPGWKQVFADDFTTNAAAGSFGDVYKNRFSTYHGFPDSHKAGTYNRDILSVNNGVLDMHLRKDASGRPQVSAPAPIVTTPWAGQTYGKFSVRFKSEALSGYKTAWLLWPDSNNWNEGEIDFPEGGLNSKIWGFNHCVGNPMQNCSWADTQATFTDWHTASIEWTPTRVTFILDGKVVGNDIKNIPRTPMHWILQTETSSSTPNITRDGHLQIDWVTVYTYNK